MATSSQASLSVGDGVSERATVSTGSLDPEVIEPTRARRWTLLFRKRGDNPPGKVKISVSCQCKSTAVKGSCLIVFASFVELLGCLIGLVYGISYIQSARNFYLLDSDPDRRVQEYDDKLERILYLEANSIGMIGLLATCVIGLLISFLMPIGTIYRSWKCLRAAMSLLFAISLAHIVLVSFYLCNSELLATIAALPFRAYELFIIYNYIRHFKKKKLQELKEKVKQASGAGASTTSSQVGDMMGLDQASICSLDKDDIFEFVQQLPKVENPSSASEAQVTFDLTNGEGLNEMEANVTPQENELISKQIKKNSKKRKLLTGWRKQERRKPRVHGPDRYIEYDFK